MIVRTTGAYVPPEFRRDVDAAILYYKDLGVLRGLTLLLCSTCGFVERDSNSSQSSYVDPDGDVVVRTTNACSRCTELLAKAQCAVEDRVRHTEKSMSQLLKGWDDFQQEWHGDLKGNTLTALRHENAELQLKLNEQGKQLIDTQRMLLALYLALRPTGSVPTVELPKELVDDLQSIANLGPEGCGAGGEVSPDDRGADSGWSPGNEAGVSSPTETSGGPIGPGCDLGGG